MHEVLNTEGSPAVNNMIDSVSSFPSYSTQHSANLRFTLFYRQIKMASDGSNEDFDNIQCKFWQVPQGTLPLSTTVYGVFSMARGT